MLNKDFETYSVPVSCSNCDYIGQKTLPKGTPFDNRFNRLSITHYNMCPSCGCNTLVKSSSGPKWNRGAERYWLQKNSDNRMLCAAGSSNMYTILRKGY